MIQYAPVVGGKTRIFRDKFAMQQPMELSRRVGACAVAVRQALLLLLKLLIVRAVEKYRWARNTFFVYL